MGKIRGNWGGHRGRGVSSGGHNQPEISFTPIKMDKLQKHRDPVNRIIQIDGSVLEGGGQILRNSIALSCLMAQPITISNIRAGRPKPGLSAQHLTGIKLVNALCGGTLENAHLGSTHITFNPGSIRSGEMYADVKTAGSVCLLLQTVLPCLLFGSGSSNLTLVGGTDADFAPPIDFFTHIFLYYFKMLADGSKTEEGCTVNDVRRGFNPKGNGQVKLGINSFSRGIAPIDFTDPGSLKQFHISVYVCNDIPVHFGQNCINLAEEKLKAKFGASVEITSELKTNEKAFGNGWGIMITADTTTGCKLAKTLNGKPKPSAETLVCEIIEALIKDIESGGCVDSKMQDQLIIFMALAHGKSRIRIGEITLHTKTAIYIAEQLTDAKFTVSKVENCKGTENSYLIECEGISLRNTYFKGSATS